jgi:hypothetical protein
MSRPIEYSMLPQMMRTNLELTLAKEWIPMTIAKPDVSDRYEVFRSSCGKMHYCQWNGSGWAYDHKEITHWRPRIAPEGHERE